MHKESRKIVQYVIAENRRAIKNPMAKFALMQNPNLVEEELENHKREIISWLPPLRSYRDKLLPFVGGLKQYIKDITEETYVCATYLLLCRILHDWESYFILAEQGRSSAAGVLLRTIKEAIMQVELFSVDCVNEDHGNLERWFLGDIIQHGVGRKKVSAHFDKFMPNAKVSMEDLSNQIYQVESQVPHNSYAGILEEVSPFTEDYDLAGPTRYFRTIALLRYAYGSLGSTNIAMKMVYATIIKDPQSYKALDEILERHGSLKNS